MSSESLMPTEYAQTSFDSMNAAQSFRQVFLEHCSSNRDFKFLTIYSDDNDTCQSSTVFSNNDLLNRTREYCNFFRAEAVCEGDTVLIVLKESLDLYASFFAAIIYGALPAYSAYPSPKQTPEQFLSGVKDLILYNKIRLVVGFAEVIQLLGQTDELNNGNFKGCFTPTQVTSLVSDTGSMQEIANFPSVNQEAFLQFSSGTTGAKKGVRISIEALFRQIKAYESYVNFDEHSCVVSWLPHYHDMGLIACILMPWVKQVPVVMMSPFQWVKNPTMLLTAIETHHGTHVWQPNFALGHLCRAVSDAPPGYDLSSLQQLICCSEPVLFETVHNFRQVFSNGNIDNLQINNCYAMAENTFAVSSTQTPNLNFLNLDDESFRKGLVAPKSDGKTKIASAGRILPNAEIRILDENRAESAPNRIGEIAIRTNCMLDGYHNNSKATDEAISDGWYFTGDLGFIHENELFVSGRKKDLIIVGGENIYPQDIELILNKEDGLIPGRNVVFGVDDPRVGTEKVIVLAESHKQSDEINTDKIRERIFNQLNISISEIVVLPHQTLKKGTAGKISRFLNRILFLEQNRSQPEAVDLKDPVSRAVQSILPNSSRDRVTEDTLLLSSGLIDSFGFTELIHAVEKETGVVIPKRFWTTNHFNSIGTITSTLNLIRQTGADISQVVDENIDSRVVQKRAASLNSLRTTKSGSTRVPFWEWLINSFPFEGNWCYRPLLRLAGIKLGKNVQFLGRIQVKLRGQNSNIVIGDNAILGDKVDLRNRENGKIVLADRTYLDANVRLVAAREGRIEIGEGTEIGANTVINSGGKTTIGKFVMVAGNVQINSSSHGTLQAEFIKAQAHEHGEVKIGDDCWLGSGVSVIMNSEIQDGVVVSSNSLVSGKLPSFSICAGVPAKVMKVRS